MAGLMDQLKSLMDAQLYEDAKHLAGFITTMCENNPDSLGMSARYQYLYQHATACFHLREYKKAQILYEEALQIKKMLTKSKLKMSLGELTSEAEIKYQLYLCFVALKQQREAINVLEGISSKQRTCKVYMALAKLYQKSGSDRSAITNFKEVLRECPMSLEAIRGLMQLGVKASEVTSHVMNALPAQGCKPDWLGLLLKALGQYSSREYSLCVQTIKQLDSKSTIKNNVWLLNLFGEALFMQGSYTQAMMFLQMAFNVDPCLTFNMDILAYLLYKDGKVQSLENLSTQLIDISDQVPQSWVAMGYYCLATKKGTRAIYFGQKAYSLDNRHVESLLLKALGLFEMKKVHEATFHYREAHRLSPSRYEAIKGVVDCYLAEHRNSEAQGFAAQAVKTMPSDARAYTLYATVLSKQPLQIDKTKSYLDKALKLDPYYLDAVYLLSEIYCKQSQYEKGIQLVRRQLEQQSTTRLHTLLAQMLTQTNQQAEALNEFSLALRFDPDNSNVRQDMELVHGGDSSLEQVSANTMSDNETEGSDIGGSLSEVELY